MNTRTVLIASLAGLTLAVLSSASSVNSTRHVKYNPGGDAIFGPIPNAPEPGPSAMPIPNATATPPPAMAVPEH